MTDTKKPWNWQTIALIGLVGYVVWTNWKPSQDDGKDDDRPIVVEPISKVLAKCYEADRVSKIAILKGLTANTFTDDEAKAKWIESEIVSRRDKDFKPFTDRMGIAVFEGKTEEMAKALEAGK